MCFIFVNPISDTNMFCSNIFFQKLENKIWWIHLNLLIFFDFSQEYGSLLKTGYQDRSDCQGWILIFWTLIWFIRYMCLEIFSVCFRFLSLCLLWTGPNRAFKIIENLKYNRKDMNYSIFRKNRELLLSIHCKHSLRISNRIRALNSDTKTIAYVSRILIKFDEMMHDPSRTYQTVNRHEFSSWCDSHSKWK